MTAKRSGKGPAAPLHRLARRAVVAAACLFLLVTPLAGCTASQQGNAGSTAPADASLPIEESTAPGTTTSASATAAPGTDTSASASQSPAAGLFPVDATRTATGPKQGTYYEVFVRAFADGDGDGIGDLRGLTAKLDYLNDGKDTTTDDLGVTGLWLMPINPSPSYHGYDVANYRDIEPDYGTMADFDAFLAAAHQRGISVIIDLVLNHTSTENPWFVQSAAKNPEYRSWYHWADSGTDDYNLDASVWGHKVWNKRGTALYYAIFWDGMPDLNYDEPAVRQEMKDVAKFWLDKGVDGFRLDAVPHIYGTGELPDNAPGLEPTLAWWKEFQTYCESVEPDVMIVGEVLDRMGTRLPFVSSLDSVFHVDLGEAIAAAVKAGSSKNDYLAGMLERELGQYREKNPDFIDCPFLSNHDQNRIYGLLAGKPENMKLAASLYLTAEGVPFVYYGEELGMFGSKPDEDIRLPFVWGDDAAQTDWRTSRYENVVPQTQQVAQAASIQTHYRRLIQLRAVLPALNRGRLAAVKSGNPGLVAWMMTAPEQQALVLHNLSREAVVIDPDMLAASVKNADAPSSAASDISEAWRLAFEQAVGTTGWTTGTSDAHPKQITLAPQSSVVLARATGGNP